MTAIALAPIRRKPWVVAALLAAAGIAWWSTAVRMQDMDGGPGTSLGSIGWFTGAWAVMMAAMMLPSLAPTAAIFPRLRRSLTFAAGYLLVWTLAGLAAYGLFELGKVLLAQALAWRSGGRWVSVGVLALAGAYQLTPLKDACLKRCRMLPDTAGAAAIAGLRAGAWCTGCTWALMAALFALGAMSLTWMALIALLVAVEKVGPSPRVGKATTAIVLLVAAAGIAAAPGHVPALVIPGAMH